MAFRVGHLLFVVNSPIEFCELSNSILNRGGGGGWGWGLGFRVLGLKDLKPCTLSTDPRTPMPKS